MVIELDEKGIFKKPYFFSCGLFSHVEDFYYKKVYIIDGCRLLLGTTEKDSRPQLLEEITGACAIHPQEFRGYSAIQIECVLQDKVKLTPYNCLRDVIIHFQNSKTEIETWKIGLLT